MFDLRIQTGWVEIAHGWRLVEEILSMSAFEVLFLFLRFEINQVSLLALCLATKVCLIAQTFGELIFQKSVVLEGDMVDFVAELMWLCDLEGLKLMVFTVLSQLRGSVVLRLLLGGVLPWLRRIKWFLKGVRWKLVVVELSLKIVLLFKSVVVRGEFEGVGLDELGLAFRDVF